MINIIGVLFSFIYFFGLLIVSQHLKKFSLEGKRKFVHIMLGNWWFVVLTLFDKGIYAIIVPAAFVLINYYSLKRNKKGGLLSELERNEERNKSYGIVLYPVAMVVLVVLSFWVFKDVRIGGIGLMALSYGDGFAALAGKKYNYIPFTVFGNRKTLSGSLAMLVVTMLSISIYLYVTDLQQDPLIILILAFVLACVTTIIEALSPYGVDNLLIPISAVFLYAVIG